MASIYVDGSQSESTAAIGIHCVLEGGDYIEISENIGDYTSTHAEMVAIFRGLELAILIGGNVTLYTEMTGMIDREGGRSRSPILTKIRAIRRAHPEIELKYVKAHSGDLHNSRADKLAYAGLTMNQVVDFESYKKVFKGYDGIVVVGLKKLHKYYSHAMFRRMFLG